MAQTGRHGIGCSERKVNQDDDDDEEHHGCHYKGRDEPHHLFYNIQSQVFILQPDVMTDQLYELTDGLYILVVGKQNIFSIL